MKVFIIGDAGQNSTACGVNRGDEFAHPDIRLWQQQSSELLEQPGIFDDQSWCAGGFAQSAMS
jgi:hypothetical protein